MPAETTIPKRALFKPAEVCSIAGVQPYILRSWEAEFPSLGGAKKGGSRVYRKADVELVLRIKDLVFSEGLTLGAARRKLEADTGPSEVTEDDAGLVGLFEQDTRDRLEQVKEGLREVLALLAEPDDSGDQRVARDQEAETSAKASSASEAVEPAMGKAPPKPRRRQARRKTA